MKTLLITGSTGFVGGRLAQHFAGQYTLLTPTKQQFGAQNIQAMHQYLQEHRPDYIIHTAALSDVGYCEAHPDESRLVNLVWPVQLAKGAQTIGAKLVAFSSDQVYTGTKQPGLLPECAACTPTNVYGRHKLAAEQDMLAECSSAVLLRAAWMYDADQPALKNSTGLPGKLALAAKQGQPLAASEQEYRGVSWLGSIVAAMPQLMHLPGGVYNAGAENTENSFDSTLAMAAQMGLPASCVCAAQGKAPRNLSMSTEKLKEFGIQLGTIQTNLRDCLAAGATF